MKLTPQRCISCNLIVIYGLSIAYIFLNRNNFNALTNHYGYPSEGYGGLSQTSQPTRRNSDELKYLWNSSTYKGNAYIWFEVRDHKLKVSKTSIKKGDNRVWQMIEIIEPVLHRIPKDGDYVLCMDDNQHEVKPPAYLLGQSGSNPTQLLPYSSFSSWSKFQIPRYQEYRKEAIYRIATFTSRNDTLFWRGNPDNDPRRYFLDQAKLLKCQNCDIWSREFTNHLNHSKYKYLLDMQGTGASGRLAPLYSLGVVIFYVARNATKKNYYDDYFEPWVDYVPVKEDASDLNEHLAMVRNDQRLAILIATNSYLKAIRYFSQDGINNHTAMVLNQYYQRFGILDDEWKV